MLRQQSRSGRRTGSVGGFLDVIRGGNSMMNTVTFHSEDKKAHSMAQRLLSSVSWLGCVAMLFALMCAGSAKAQLSGKGAITGTVTDKSGAVIPGAEIAA